MFSQFRQAVESLAQPLQDNALPRSQSPDSQRQSSSQLAENALVNLRKSIAVQRNAGAAQQNTGQNPRPRSASPGPSSVAKSATEAALRKTTLEERLRASFAPSESSGGNTSSTVPVTLHPLSPPSTPVPDSTSPAVGSTTSVSGNPVDGSVQAQEGTGIVLAPPPQEPNDLPNAPLPVEPQDPALTDNTPTDSTIGPDVGETPTQEVPLVAHSNSPQPDDDVPQPSEVTETSTVDTDPPGEDSVQPKPELSTIDKSGDASVDALQERLKLVEQRFTGKVACCCSLGPA